MDKVNFGVLDGTVALNGTYDPRVMSRPLFNFDMDMKNINAKQAYASFNTIQKLAPAAKNLEGSFSTRFALNGPLTQQMMPDYPGLNGGGVISLTWALLKNLEMINGLNKITHLNLPADVNLKDVVIKATVVNGRANFAPFTINAGGNQVTLSGSQGFDGTIDYLAKMNVPAGIAGAALNNALAALSGTKATGNQNVKLNVKITGTNASPKYALAGTDAATTDNVAKSAVNGAIDQAKKEAQAKLDAAKADAEAKAKVEADRLKKQAEDQAKAEQEKLKQQAKDKAADALKDAKKKLGF